LILNNIVYTYEINGATVGELHKRIRPVCNKWCMLMKTHAHGYRA